MALEIVSGLSFAAVDFETADRRPGSACAVGAVLVRDGEVIERMRSLIRPPPSSFRFSAIHNITADQVEHAPHFASIWPRLVGLLRSAHFIAAHNTSFDRAVLRACCSRACLQLPSVPFLCTIRVAERHWPLTSYSLPAVCGHLGIELRHHDPLSDAEACARIVLAARPVLVCDSLSGRLVVRFADGGTVRVRGPSPHDPQ